MFEWPANVCGFERNIGLNLAHLQSASRCCFCPGGALAGLVWCTSDCTSVSPFLSSILVVIALGHRPLSCVAFSAGPGNSPTRSPPQAVHRTPQRPPKVSKLPLVQNRGRISPLILGLRQSGCNRPRTEARVNRHRQTRRQACVRQATMSH